MRSFLVFGSNQLIMSLDLLLEHLQQAETHDKQTERYILCNHPHDDHCVNFLTTTSNHPHDDHCVNFLTTTSNQ